MYRQIVLLPVAVFTLFGCSSAPSLDAYSSFATTTESVSSDMTAYFSEFSTVSVEHQLHSVAATYQGAQAAKLEPETITLISSPFEDRKRANALTLYKSADALRKYAASLNSLANAVNEDDIKLASSQMLWSIKGMSEQYSEYTGKSLGDYEKYGSEVTAFISTLGTSYLNREKDKALREIIIQADESVSLLIGEMVSALENGGVVVLYRIANESEINDMVLNYRKVAKDPDTSYQMRRDLVTSIYQKSKEMDAFEARSLVTINALKEIKSTHNTMATAFAEDDINKDTIMNAVGQLKYAHGSYRSLNKLIEKCTDGVTRVDNVLTCK
ncbi:hypothetical protein [Enterovibrio baiacu]|uniref:hypothetical protein n=1 Tax=Enterovibrio baiacu TaxID=2491023 RepID=UPI001011B178|nr:hypothetical protein [Enterovibrio baiacu]MBE1274288.1 hypothetical protein [Enterovibrio baiacu]